MHVYFTTVTATFFITATFWCENYVRASFVMALFQEISNCHFHRTSNVNCTYFNKYVSFKNHTNGITSIAELIVGLAVQCRFLFGK